MAIDSKNCLISGVPLEQDLGPHAFSSKIKRFKEGGTNPKILL